MMKKPLLSTLLVLSLSLSFIGCRRFNIPYHIDIEQGNIVTQEQVDQLRPGMNKREVGFLLGTPLIEDAFNPERWEYYYSMLTGYGKYTRTHIVLYFDADEQLSRIEGDMYPGGKKTAAEEEIARERKAEAERETKYFIPQELSTAEEGEVADEERERRRMEEIEGMEGSY